MEQLTRYQDPKGGAHGRAPFSDRAMEWRVRKSRMPLRSPDCSSRGGHFFLVIFFFGPAKKKSLGRGSGRKITLSQCNAMVRVPLARRADRKSALDGRVAAGQSE